MGVSTGKIFGMWPLIPGVKLTPMSVLILKVAPFEREFIGLCRCDWPIILRLMKWNIWGHGDVTLFFKIINLKLGKFRFICSRSFGHKKSEHWHLNFRRERWPLGRFSNCSRNTSLANGSGLAAELGPHDASLCHWMKGQSSVNNGQRHEEQRTDSLVPSGSISLSNSSARKQNQNHTSPTHRRAAAKRQGGHLTHNWRAWCTPPSAKFQVDRYVPLTCEAKKRPKAEILTKFSSLYRGSRTNSPHHG